MVKKPDFIAEADIHGGFTVYKVTNKSKQEICTIPHWLDDPQHDANLIAAQLNNLPETTKASIGIKL